jgi:hypothetical protein
LQSVEAVGPDVVSKTPLAVASIESEVRRWEEQMRTSLRRESVDKDTLTDEIRYAKARGDLAYFEMAAKLVALKRICDHGDFARRLDELSIHPRLAQRAMAAAIRILGSDLSGTPRAALVGAGPSKVAELMSLDDEALDEIAEGAELGGIALDKLDRMSVRELRERIRKLEKKADDAKEAHDADAFAANELKRENTRLRRQWSALPIDEKLAARREDVDLVVAAIERQLGDYGAERATAALAGAVQALLDDAGDEHAAQAQVHIASAISRLELSLRAVRDAYVVG